MLFRYTKGLSGRRLREGTPREDGSGHLEDYAGTRRT